MPAARSDIVGFVVRRPSGLHIRVGPEKSGVQRSKARRDVRRGSDGVQGSALPPFVDPDHSVGEERYVVLGMSNQRQLLVVAVAERPPRTRLI